MLLQGRAGNDENLASDYVCARRSGHCVRRERPAIATLRGRDGAPGSAGRWRALRDTRRAAQQFVELSRDARRGLAHGRAARRQHAADAGRVGTGRAQRGAFRFLFRRHAARSGAGTRHAAGAAVVRDVEEHRPFLRARLGQARHAALCADAQGGRVGACSFQSAWRGDDAGRCARLCGADAPSRAGRSPAHGGDDAGRERER